MEKKSKRKVFNMRYRTEDARKQFEAICEAMKRDKTSQVHFWIEDEARKLGV